MGKKDNNDWSLPDSPKTSETAAAEAPAPAPKPKIPFEHWFDKKLKAGAVRFYQDDTMLIFFKEQGLTALEDEDEYEKAFKKF